MDGQVPKGIRRQFYRASHTAQQVRDHRWKQRQKRLGLCRPRGADKTVGGFKLAMMRALGMA